jgi:hypothetical protein
MFDMLAEKMMTLREARSILQDTSRISPEAIEAAQKVIDWFYAEHPRHKVCVACGSMRWEERTGRSGDSVWCCVGCHRSSDLTQQQWFAEQAPMRAKESRRNAALKRIVAEEWEPLIAKAVEARADYIEALGDIAWLLRNGAAPANDARGAQLLVETDTAPSRWQAASLAASGGRLAARIAALESGE